jgi:dipeptidyl aminopeptidase/acylaminoacyl peptidase
MLTRKLNLTILCSTALSLCMTLVPAEPVTSQGCVESAAADDSYLSAKILCEMKSYYPVPISTSQDASRVVERARPEKSNEEVLVVLDVATGKTQRSLKWANSIVHVHWRDAHSISFFSQDPTSNVRRLFVWNLDDGKTTEIPVPLTFNQPHVLWSPDGAKLAFSRETKSVVIVEDKGRGDPIEYDGKIATFAWSSDSRNLALVPDDNSHQILVLDASSGQVTQRITTLALGKVVDVSWHPRADMLVLLQHDDDSRSLLELDVKGHESILLSSKSDLRAPSWLPRGHGYIFQRFENGAGALFVSQDGGDTPPRRLPLDGVTDFQGFLPGGKTIVAMHRSDGPPELLQVPLDGGTSKVLAAADLSVLPKVRPEEVYVSSFDGMKIPLWVWRSPYGKETSRAAVVRVHGNLHGAESPVWQEEIQMYLKHGVDFIGVNYRGSSGYGSTFEAAGNDFERSWDVAAACKYAHSSLAVSYDRVVLLGHSTGAALALGAGLIEGDHIGTLVLVSLPGMPRGWQTYMRSNHRPLYVLAVHGEKDRLVPPAVAKALIENAFGPGVLIPLSEHWSVLKDEDHVLHLDRSWAVLHSLILRKLEMPLPQGR